jgi:hypothetical protein
LSIATKSEASGETVFGFLSSILIVSTDRKPTFAKTLTKTLIVAGGSLPPVTNVEVPSTV